MARSWNTLRVIRTMITYFVTDQCCLPDRPGSAAMYFKRFGKVIDCFCSAPFNRFWENSRPFDEMILLSIVYERKTPMSNDLMKEIVKYHFTIVKRSGAVYIKNANRNVQG